MGLGKGIGDSLRPEGALIRQPRATPCGKGCSRDNALKGQKNKNFVQADMLSACIEYEDILSDKQRGAHPSPPKGREPDTHPLFLGGCTAGYCGLKILILDSGG